MEERRRVFPSIDKTKMFLRGTPTDSSSVGFFFLQSFVSFFFLSPNGVTASERKLQQNNCVLPQNGHTV